MNAKISVIIICVEAIIYFLLYDLYDCTFKRISKMILLLVKRKKCCKGKRSVLNKLLISKVVNKVEYSRVYIFYKEKRFSQICMGI